MTIGELCDRLPEMPGWESAEPPVFHFPPGKALKGTEIAREALKQRHVIEVCPFRAWVLSLQHTKSYDLANALNLGIMADLAYAEEFSADKDARLIPVFLSRNAGTCPVSRSLRNTRIIFTPWRWMCRSGSVI